MRAVSSRRVASASDTSCCASSISWPRCVLAAEAFRVDLVDILGPGRPRGEPARFGRDLQAADRRAVAGRRGEDRADRLAGERGGTHRVRGQPAQHRLLGGRRARVDPPVGRRHRSGRSARSYAAPGSRPVRAVSSAVRRHAMIPSLSVVHTVPSRRRNDAPALSSPPKPTVPSTQPVDEPLEPHRHLEQAPPEVGGDAIDHRARRRASCRRRPPGPRRGRRRTGRRPRSTGRGSG